MKATLPDAPPSETFSFGVNLLHGRFVLAIELLAQIVMASPRSLSIAVLSDTLGHPVAVVREVLANLAASELVCPDPGRTVESWKCFADMSASITLADIFRSVNTPVNREVAAGGKTVGTKKTAAAQTEARQNIDLLLMQASMEINQVIMQHLQRFDLGRLKATARVNSFIAGNSNAHSFFRVEHL